MSLSSAFYTGVSGLNAQSNALASVADNITNVNTVGYKEAESQFVSLVTDGRTDTTYTAGGVTLASRSLISKQGLLQASSGATDLGIQGDGFFVTRTESPTGTTVAYTRAGAFAPDTDGYLKNSAGFFLQGWKLDSSGNFANNGTASNLESVRLSNLSGTAAPTTKIALSANVQSTTPLYAGTYAAGDMAAGTATPAFNRSLQVFDAQGNPHNLTLGMVRTDPNTWQTEIYANPATDVSAAGGLLASGTMKFNPDGSLDVAGSSPALFAPINAAWTNGAGAQPITLDLGNNGGMNGFTQFASASGTTATTIDGGIAGDVASIDISKTGVVSAVFADGSKRAVYQLPLATFANPDGLTRVSGNGYTVSGQSGAVLLNAASTAGSGSISEGTLEQSNVDLASEFTNMIRFQRAYSASSKIITTVDEMMQEINNLKR
ncbi:flagellar hook protein FlgE [soil metagenome]